MKKALWSIFNQTFKEFEVVIVDDASTDDTEKVAKKFIKKFGEKVNYIKREKNFGNHSQPKNNGIMASKADLIAYLDDDCEFRKDHLQALFNEFQKDPSLDVAYGDRWITSSVKEMPSGKGVAMDYIPALLAYRNYIDTSDVLMKKSILYEVGGWDEGLKRFADWNLWVRLSKLNKKFRRVPIILTEYYLHEGSMQMKSKDMFDPIDCKIYPDKTIFGKKDKLKVAIYTLTYDRPEYTKEMFKWLKKLTDYPYDHFIVDNGSKKEGLKLLDKLEADKGLHIKKIIRNKTNVGISKASNQALDVIGNDYDIIIKLDNDCKILTQGWLSKFIEIFERSRQFVLSPSVEGLRDHPGGTPRVAEKYFNDELLGITTHLGGIFVVAPKQAYKDFRWKENDFLHGEQDRIFSEHCRKNGFCLAYVENVRCEHQEGTAGQETRFPEYFERRKFEKTHKYEDTNHNS